MLRVMLLAPFLLVLSFVVQDKKEGHKHSITIPWFAFIFILVSGLNSLNIIPEDISHLFIQLDTILLTMAMAALGLRTHIGAIRQAGFKPLLLATILFIFLIIGGLYINEGITAVFN